ncbi:MAG TPA: hypothetical protein VE631_04730 [Alphaproteobacteria bacterium]|nr:hypothetical protein [Alphaproteobacteria bacterium]
MIRLLLVTLLLPLAMPPALAGGLTVVVDEADCRWLVRHEPAPDVTYQPGVDVNGNPVAPADLGPDHGGAAAPVLPKQIAIDLDIPLSRLLPDGTPPNLEDAKANAGTVTVDRETGAVSYNGQPLVDPAREHLIAACRAHAKER